MIKPALIIPYATSRDQAAIAQINQSENSEDYSWHLLTVNYNKTDLMWETTVGKEVSRINRLIRDLRQQSQGHCQIGVVPTNDFGAMAASIAAEFSGESDSIIPGLGMIPVMRCRHKYYLRLATSPHMLAEPSLWLEDSELPSVPVNYPFYAKLPLANMALGGQLIETPEQLSAYKSSVFPIGRKFLKQLVDLPVAVVDELPLLTRNAFLAEVPILMNQVTVMGRCVQGNVMVDAVIETVFHPGTRNVECFRWPAQLSDMVMAKICEVACATVTKLDFLQGMWNIELWWDTGTEAPFVEVIEINPRPAVYFEKILQLGAGYSIYLAAADIALGGSGLPLNPPKQQGFVEQKSISTSGEGIAKDLVDFKALQELDTEEDTIVIYYYSPNDLIQQLTPYPTIVAETVSWSS